MWVSIAVPQPTRSPLSQDRAWWSELLASSTPANWRWCRHMQKWSEMCGDAMETMDYGLGLYNFKCLALNRIQLHLKDLYQIVWADLANNPKLSFGNCSPFESWCQNEINTDRRRFHAEPQVGWLYSSHIELYIASVSSSFCVKPGDIWRQIQKPKWSS